MGKIPQKIAKGLPYYLTPDTLSNKAIKMLIFLLKLVESIKFSVSGFSSGGFMSMQMHIAHSSLIQGVGIIAGGPYHCMQTYSQKTCTKFPNKIEISRLVKYAKEEELKGNIDSLTNLNSTEVWLFGGTKDKMVLQGIVGKVSEFYEYFQANVEFVQNIESQHMFVTDSFGSLCGVYEWPYIANCQFDSAGRILSKIYGELLMKKPYSQRRLHKFDQRVYESDQVGMADFGYIYVPESCWIETCRVHMVLHGCGMNTDYIGSFLIKFAGYNEWAEANSLIIIYPQAARHHKLNYGACWDASGSWDPNYSTKKGKHLSILFNISQNVPRILESLLLIGFDN